MCNELCFMKKATYQTRAFFTIFHNLTLKIWIIRESPEKLNMAIYTNFDYLSIVAI